MRSGRHDAVVLRRAAHQSRIWPSYCVRSAASFRSRTSRRPSVSHHRLRPRYRRSPPVRLREVRGEPDAVRGPGPRSGAPRSAQRRRAGRRVDRGHRRTGEVVPQVVRQGSDRRCAQSRFVLQPLSPAITALVGVVALLPALLAAVALVALPDAHSSSSSRTTTLSRVHRHRIDRVGRVDGVFRWLRAERIPPKDCAPRRWLGLRETSGQTARSRRFRRRRSRIRTGTSRTQSRSVSR